MADGVVAARRRVEIGLERRQRTRERLVLAAARVIAQHGDAKATIDDFITAAEVARGTFYNYFQTREGVLDAVWEHVGREPFLEIHNHCSSIADPALRLVAETRMVLDRAGRDETWGWLVHALSSGRIVVNPDLLTFPLPTLAEGVRAGRFTIGDLGGARDAIVAIVRSALQAQLLHRSSAEYRSTVLEMMMLALGLERNEVIQILARDDT